MNREKDRLDMVQIRMVPDRTYYSEKRVNSPEDAVNLLVQELKDLDRECFVILNLNAKMQPINANIVSMGDLHSAMATPRELFKGAILSNAACTIIMHNHPSGILEPSKDDILTTERILQCGKLLGIPLQDHIIFNSKEDMLSFREKGLINPDEVVSLDKMKGMIETIAEEADELESAKQAAESEQTIIHAADFCICRQIDGKQMKFALTRQELLDAYFLQRRVNSIEYVEAKLEDVEVDNDENLLYGMPIDEIFEHRDLIERLADTMVEIADEKGCPDWEALDEAYEKVIPDYVRAAEEDLTERINALSEDEMREMLLGMKYNDQKKIMDEYFGETSADGKGSALRQQKNQFDFDLE